MAIWLIYIMYARSRRDWWWWWDADSLILMLRMMN